MAKLQRKPNEKEKAKNQDVTHPSPPAEALAGGSTLISGGETSRPLR
jgi:hypothetical protein